MVGKPMGFDFSTFRMKTHLRIFGWYCKSPEPHEGPCPMVPTLFYRLRYFLRTGKGLPW